MRLLALNLSERGGVSCTNPIIAAIIVVIIVAVLIVVAAAATAVAVD